ncbi:hypothetical protein ACFSUD_15425 [Sulfitobacter aestuarii]|uniref:Oligogalacturonate lyase n=1 Tax=Sulfitobacter aestuarii TaxID=2161676 RepID=A0ABW5U5S4_9RHOB
MSAIKSAPCPIRKVGDGTAHHFFGYYNKSIWDPAGEKLLAVRVPWLTRDLQPEDGATVGYFDLTDGDRFYPLGTTTAWNWQMGCQLQWLPETAGQRVVYNVRSPKAGGQYPGLAAAITEIPGGEVQMLHDPVYSVSPDGSFAICVDYRRFNITHPTIGYTDDTSADDLPLAPTEDGIFRMDMHTGKSELVLSLHALTRNEPVASMEGAIHWVTHLEINPGSDRVLFIHRWTRRVEDETCFLHRLYSMAPDGSALTLLECTDHPIPHLDEAHDPDRLDTFDYEKSEYQISHPIWRDDRHIMVWGPNKGEIHYQLYDIDSGKAEVVGADVLTENGHMTYSPDGKWMVSDTYPDKETNIRILFLYHLESGVRYDVAELQTDPDLGKENRCDLHPRWHPQGNAVCVDSVHEGERQLYIVDVSALTEG